MDDMVVEMGGGRRNVSLYFAREMSYRDDLQHFEVEFTWAAGVVPEAIESEWHGGGGALRPGSDGNLPQWEAAVDASKSFQALLRAPAASAVRTRFGEMG